MGVGQAGLRSILSTRLRVKPFMFIRKRSMKYEMLAWNKEQVNTEESDESSSREGFLEEVALGLGLRDQRTAAEARKEKTSHLSRLPCSDPVATPSAGICKTVCDVL